MGIFQRISDIMSANINHLLEKSEDPEKMIKQVINEMYEKIQEARAATAQTRKDCATEKAALRDELEVKIEKLEKSVAVCHMKYSRAAGEMAWWQARAQAAGVDETPGDEIGKTNWGMLGAGDSG